MNRFTSLNNLRRSSRLALVAIAVLTALAFVPTEAAASPLGYFIGESYSTYGFTQAGPLNTQLGKLTYVPCPCTGTNGQVVFGSLPSMDAGSTLHTAALYASVFTDRTASTAVVKNTAEVNGIFALGGLITADKVLAVANTTANASTIASTDNGSLLLNLRIGGTLVNANVAPNTQFNLAGFGNVIVRENKKTGDGTNKSTITVNMLHVFITTQNALNLPIGAQIIIAHANSGFVRAPVQLKYSGTSYVTTAKALTPPLQAQLGLVAPSYLGCQGTNGKTNTNNIVSLKVPNLISLGTGETTAFGGPENGGFVARTTSNVATVKLFNGQIKADSLTAKATSTFKNGVGTPSTAGSAFVNLQINGSPVLNVQANTKINLPGIGYVILYEVKQTGSSAGATTSVTMIHVFVTTSNTLGLPVGSEIMISSASSAIKPF